MRLYAGLLLLVALCWGLVEPRSGMQLDRLIGLVDRISGEPLAASETDFAADSAALQEEGDQIKSAEHIDDEEDEHRDQHVTSPPHVVHLPLPPLPPLPALPHLPPLSLHHERETITATRTLYAEVTRRVTRHPVCLTVYGVKPPCLPVNLHANHHHVNHDSDCWARDQDVDIWSDEQPEGLYIEPTVVLRIPETTAVPTLPQSDDALELEPSREGRYLEFRRETPTPPISSSIEEDDNPRLLNRHQQTETHVITKTSWVTKVQKVTDHRVTATLEAKNCVPQDLKIPFCVGPPPPKPSHHKPPTTIIIKPPPPSHPPHHHHHIIKPPHGVIPNPPHHKPAAYKPPGPVHWKDGEKEENVETAVEGSEVNSQEELVESV